MFRIIALYGLVGGLIAAIPMDLMMVLLKDHAPLSYALLIGYTTMLIALSTVFVAIKRRRDVDLGGVIGFWSALGLGLGISFVASVIYVLAWELALAITHVDFIAGYSKMLIAQAKAKGESAVQIAKITSDMAQMKIQYANPLYRLSESFTEIFPVGVLVSLVSAGLLCNRRFLPARRS